jgi:hypothetical protein
VNHEVLIDTDQLPSIEAKALARARELSIPEPFLAEDIPGRRALLLSLTFEKWPDLLEGTPPISLEQRFYNEYFWFRRFAFLWQERREPDAGLEQQAFDKLSKTSADIDWNVIETLDQLARTPEPA